MLVVVGFVAGVAGFLFGVAFVVWLENTRGY